MYAEEIDILEAAILRTKDDLAIEIWQTLKSAVLAQQTTNSASIQLPPSCKVCILNKMCSRDYASEQCWHNAVTAYFA